MTATEVRDRLDHRFKLLVGSRRGLDRHQTLRHAVQWSYDLLDDAEKMLLDRCSVFAGGFDVESACAVAGSDGADDNVNSRHLRRFGAEVAPGRRRSAGRTRFSMLETIRQFAEDQLVARGEATKRVPRMPATSPDEKPTFLRCGTAPDSARRTTGSPSNYRICVPRSAGLPNKAIWTSPQQSGQQCRPGWGFLTENYEPISCGLKNSSWPARAVDHARLTALSNVLTSLCYNTGRIDSAIRYTEAAERGRSAVEAITSPWYTAAGFPLAVPTLPVGQPERWVQWCRCSARTRSRHRPVQHDEPLVIALTVAGSNDDAMAAAGGLIDAAEATGNPYVLSWALVAHGYRLPRR